MKVTLSAYCFREPLQRQVFVEVSDVVEERFHRIRRKLGLSTEKMLGDMALSAPVDEELLESIVVSVLNQYEVGIANHA